MSEEPQHTHTALEIVREFFPATSARLLPRDNAYRLERLDGGDVSIVGAGGLELLRLRPVEPAGDPPTPLCCDLCQQTATRRDLSILRAEVPGSGGRRFRYVIACLDTEACDARRLDDAPVESLLRSA